MRIIIALHKILQFPFSRELAGIDTIALMYLCVSTLIKCQPSAPHSYQVVVSNNQILRIALPISVAILVPQINFITNNIFLGGLNEESLAAAGITGVFYLVFAVIGNGLNNGLQALIARRAGENRVDVIGKTFSSGAYLNCAGLRFPGYIGSWLIGPLILKFLRSSRMNPATRPYHFLRIRILGLPFLYLYQMRNALLVGINQSRFLIYGTLCEASVNILLDYGLIYGHFGLPHLGFNGAAYASIAAEAAGLLAMYLVINYRGIAKQLRLNEKFKFDYAASRLIITQSAPLMFQYAISVSSWVFFYFLVEHHGERSLAISNAMRNIFGLFGVFTWAFASTTNSMVSNIIGQGKKEEVIGLIHKIARLSISFAVIVAILLNIFPRLFLSLYGQDAGFVADAIPVIRIVSTALVMMSFATVWLNAVTGTGNTKVNLGIEVITIFFYCLFVYLVLQYWNLPILYGWMSEWVYWILTFSLSYFYIRSGKWKQKVL